MELLWQQVMQQSLAEVLAVICSLLYVHLAAKQQLWCWPFALASTALYTWIFWETSLFFQSVLNAWYLIMAVYGWLNWRKVAKTGKEQVQQWGVRQNVLLSLSLLLVSVLAFQVLSFVSPEPIIFLDLAIAIYSAFVTYMLAQKVLENWLYWSVLNSLTAWLCYHQGLLLTALLFAIYVLFSIKGYINWRNNHQLVYQHSHQG
ncbi:nicotinamide riboside transporter PnuC [Planctobacterium marinum]|uniref:Nicotinamide riboside transporter PnuC n=1 Tax=Planctobacterium marinum TaxID=1631968 RepID=A0AA48HL50_9ALTE|nr:nicotinamide mononucleotide transporter [Planctobacterium marinum]